MKLYNFDEFKEKIDDVRQYFKQNNYSLQALNKTYIPALIEQDFKGDWIEECLKIRAFGKAITKEKFIELYGQEKGSEKYSSYCAKQSYSNSKEYKGMTDDEFKAFNKSRAVTLKNLISKYGEIEGTARFNEYREKQKYTKSIDYLRNKYGEKAEEIYKNINLKKGHGLNNYIIRYKDEKIALQKYVEYCNSHNKSFYSKMASSLFEKLEKDLNIKHCYYAPKTKEFGLYSKYLKKYVSFDFVIPECKLCIEFNGNCFHANPKLFKKSDAPNPFNKSLTSEMIWEYDKLKLKTIQDAGYTVIVVWENEIDYNNLKENVKSCLKLKI